MLSGCYTVDSVESTNHKQLNNAKSRINITKDGPPAGPIPVFFEKLKPKFEPFSRYGNPSSYNVGGRTYHVMRTSKGYKERGIASWYGTKFHSQRTSSGEKYSMYAMTAAHRTLPLPTYVKVKNLTNGREAIVKVNDRGPFHSSRVIDLSYAAATKLGVLPNGTALVEVTAVDVTPPGKKHVARYYVQAGAFITEKSAQDLKNNIRKFSTNAVSIEKYKQRYVVNVGPFVNKYSTDSFKKQLTKRGVKGAFSVLR